MIVIVGVFVSAFAPAVHRFPAIRAGQVLFSFEAFTLLAPRRETGAKLGDICLTGAAETAWPRLAQAHAQRAMH